MNKRTYPYYGKYPATGLVVYFTSNSTGVVVKADNNHPEDQLLMVWDEAVFIPTFFKGENEMKLTKGSFIIGSENKASGAISVAANPKQHTNFVSAASEAERLANADKDKKFVVLEVKGIVSVASVNWE